MQQFEVVLDLQRESKKEKVRERDDDDDDLSKEEMKE